ncbi:MAG: site-2 protease family protein [Parcubacteria group bacterium]|nr:site-2 protease family protein [Parcubacteria group bacterium]
MEILVAIVVFSVLILVHELGHFLVARRAGMRVEEFGLGLPPRIWGRQKGETVYSVNALPFGGFVKIYGESGPEVSEQQSVNSKHQAFYTKSVGARFLVLVAGVFMNFLLGVVLFSILYTAGLPTVTTERNKPFLRDPRVELLDIAKDSPAYAAGLKPGDALQKLFFGGETVEVVTVDEVQTFLAAQSGEEIGIIVGRNGVIVEAHLVPRKNPPIGEGPLGVSLAEAGTLQYPWYRSIWEGFLTSVEVVERVAQGLWVVIRELVTRGGIPRGVAGPIGIVGIAGEVAKLGLTRVLLFAAMITINLAVLNVLPIPALDGGRVLFLLIEKVRGRPLSRKIEATTHAIGMALLLGLIILVSIQDIKRFF